MIMMDATTQPSLIIILIITAIIRGILSRTLFAMSKMLLSEEEREVIIAIISEATVLLMICRVIDGTSEPVFTTVNAQTIPMTIAGIN